MEEDYITLTHVMGIENNMDCKVNIHDIDLVDVYRWFDPTTINKDLTCIFLKDRSVTYVQEEVAKVR